MGVVVAVGVVVLLTFADTFVVLADLGDCQRRWTAGAADLTRVAVKTVDATVLNTP
jgi:hypothetical protein